MQQPWIRQPSQGIVRFDGWHFTVMHFSREISAPGLGRAMAQAPDGALWAGTNKGQLRIPSDSLDQFGVLPATIFHVGSEPATRSPVCTSGGMAFCGWAQTRDCIVLSEARSHLSFPTYRFTTSSRTTPESGGSVRGGVWRARLATPCSESFPMSLIVRRKHTASLKTPRAINF